MLIGDAALGGLVAAAGEAFYPINVGATDDVGRIRVLFIKPKGLVASGSSAP